ncbi:hypothetical protein THAOC_17068, partial [Thalassiosira oceanica]
MLACLVDELAVKTVDVLFSRNANDPPRHPIARGYLLHAGRNGRKLQVELQIRPPVGRGRLGARVCCFLGCTLLRSMARWMPSLREGESRETRSFERNEDSSSGSRRPSGKSFAASVAVNSLGLSGEFCPPITALRTGRVFMLPNDDRDEALNLEMRSEKSYEDAQTAGARTPRSTRHTRGSKKNTSDALDFRLRAMFFISDDEGQTLAFLLSSKMLNRETPSRGGATKSSKESQSLQQWDGFPSQLPTSSPTIDVATFDWDLKETINNQSEDNHYMRMSSDGSVFALGTRANNNIGSLHVYELSGDTVTIRETLLGDDDQQGYFGNGVAFSADGSVMAASDFGYEDNTGR